MDEQLAFASLTHRARHVARALDEIPQTVASLEGLPATSSSFHSKARVTVEGMFNRLPQDHAA